MSVLSAIARRALLVLIGAAAYGWQDRLRGLPGPRVALVLPLREPSHHAAVPLAGLLVVWLVAFAVAAVVVPARVLPRPLTSLLRGVGTFAAVVVVQAVSLELVREATTGFAWHAALTGTTPYVAGGCAALATLVATPRRTRDAAAAILPPALERPRVPLASRPRATV